MMAKLEERDDDRPVSAKAQLLSLLLAIVALAGYSAAFGVVGAVLFDPDIKHPVNPMTWVFMAVFAAVGAAATWGLVRLKPWASRGPVSPATRRTNNLFTLSGLVTVPGVLALYLATFSKEDPNAIFSSSPIAPWIAIFASASWLLGMVVAWWWYFSADEHERSANDQGGLISGGLFATVTPMWWVAARAGLVPPPDAMVLWITVMLVWTAVWFWHRHR